MKHDCGQKHGLWLHMSTISTWQRRHPMKAMRVICNGCFMIWQILLWHGGHPGTPGLCVQFMSWVPRVFIIKPAASENLCFSSFQGMHREETKENLPSRCFGFFFFLADWDINDPWGSHWDMSNSGKRKFLFSPPNNPPKPFLQDHYGVPHC